MFFFYRYSEKDFFNDLPLTLHSGRLKRRFTKALRRVEVGRDPQLTIT